MKRSTLALGIGVATVGHFLPSTLVLGQWTSRENLGSLVLWRLPQGDNRVAVTFDDGPDLLGHLARAG
jgi:hypothetical protein